MKKHRSNDEKQQQYTLKKLSVGLLSVAIGAVAVLAGPTYFAEEINTTVVAGLDQTTIVEATVPATTVETSASQAPSKEAPALSQVQAENTEVPAVAAGYFRLHLKTLPAGDIANLGLWIWDDVEQPSANWPADALSLKDAQNDDYGYYIDIKLSEKQQKKISWLINDKVSGQNLTGDKNVELLAPAMNEAWVDEEFNSHTYPPLEKGFVRINYRNADDNYDNLTAWLFDDVKEPSKDWPKGAANKTGIGPYGAYWDVPLKDAAKLLGFVLLDQSKTGDDMKIQPNDYKFQDLEHHTQVFVHDKDPKVYNNPYYIDQVVLKGAEQTEETEIKATFSTLAGVTKEELQKGLTVKDKDGQEVTITDMTITDGSPVLTITGDFNQSKGMLTVSYAGVEQKVRMSWELKDKLFAYDGDLGAKLNDDGSQVEMSLWSPSADSVKVIVYDKDDQSKVMGTVDMTKGEKGVWSAKLDNQSGLNISNYTGYYYHYEITRDNQKVLVLDPYAKSLAEWDNNMVQGDIKTAKAAFVNPSKLGPQDLDFANIENFQGREDAIIYEANVRDFTSDSTLDGKLNSRFGTFSAFVEKLDYLKSLGVTHIQLMPIMSYFYVNEADHTRSIDYSSKDNNYNWGYDPQNYFSLSGMYSENAKDPEQRIAEFKNLVNEIHKRGMGVTLDVVYNHTAKTYIFEDLEPNYYHFMNADGTPRESFGGGRLGTTHAMSRRVLVDSIRYLTSEFKVDGFRFDMMGDHDAQAIEEAFNEAKAINPNVIMIGEGWKTYHGDEAKPQQPADQTWMKSTDTVGVFSDDIRNSLKSGFPNEGEAAFITGGARDIEALFKNIKAQPGNFEADSPGDVVQYIAAHDNLTLHDVIAKSINKDPKVAEEEIHKRLRLGNTMILTAQGTPFIHSGQEYGRTKQFLNPAYIGKVAESAAPYKSTLIDAVTEYPYFIHDSYDSSDAINHFDWEKATNEATYPINVKTQKYTTGLIALRRSTDAFRKTNKADIDRDVTLLSVPKTQTESAGVEETDLFIAYQTVASNGDIYAVIINADTKVRQLDLSSDQTKWADAQVLVDAERAGTEAIVDPKGLTFTENQLSVEPLTALVLKVAKKGNQPTPQPTTTTTSEPGNATTTQTSTSPTTKSQSGKNKSNLPSTGSQASPIFIIAGGSLLTILLASLGIKVSKKEN